MKKILLLSLILSQLIFNLTAEKFEFKYTKGESYRILSTVDEDVFV